MFGNVHNKIIEKLNYFGGKFSVIRDVSDITLNHIENDSGIDLKITSLVTVLDENIGKLYTEYSEFIKNIEFPNN